MSESILEEAQRIIHGDRNVAYGHPRDNFAAIAAQWNAYLQHMGDRELNSLDVANLMILMKVARVINGVYHRDSYTDMAGYAGTGERLQEPVEPEAPGWKFFSDVPWGVYIVKDKNGDTWQSYGGQTRWLRDKDGKDSRHVIYTGPYAKA